MQLHSTQQLPHIRDTSQKKCSRIPVFKPQPDYSIQVIRLTVGKFLPDLSVRVEEFIRRELSGCWHCPDWGTAQLPGFSEIILFTVPLWHVASARAKDFYPRTANSAQINCTWGKQFMVKAEQGLDTCRYMITWYAYYKCRHLQN